MKRYKVGACGNFDLDPNFLNGQIIRTRSIMDQIEIEIGPESIRRVSYAAWKKHPFKVLGEFISLFLQCENVLVFPDLRAIHVLVPLAVIFTTLTKTRTYYIVIGGWLPDFLHEHTLIRKCAGMLDGLFVQTAHLAYQLRSEGIQNVIVFPNFKNLKICSLNEKPVTYTRPLSLVYMSRISERKGIQNLVAEINRINKDGIHYTLDIYGSIQNGFEKEFTQLEKQFGKAIRYNGQVDPLETSTVMKDYFLHVFPTTFQTEGYPGSVLDALSAGVPTLSARWVSYEDVLVEGKTGLSYTLGDWDELRERLVEIDLNPDKIWDMREACIEEAQKYRPENVIKIMLKELNL